VNSKQVGYLSVFLGIFGGLLLASRLTMYMFSQEYGLSSGMYAPGVWVILGAGPLLCILVGILWFFVTEERIRNIHLIFPSLLGALYLPVIYSFYPFAPSASLPEVQLIVLVGVTLFVVLPIIFKMVSPRQKGIKVE
jgi:hypothetical protein